MLRMILAFARNSFLFFFSFIWFLFYLCVCITLFLQEMTTSNQTGQSFEYNWQQRQTRSNILNPELQVGIHSVRLNGKLSSVQKCFFLCWFYRKSKEGARIKQIVALTVLGWNSCFDLSAEGDLKKWPMTNSSMTWSTLLDRLPSVGP